MSNQLTNTVDQVIGQGTRGGVLHNIASAPSADGREIVLDGKKMLNFGSCSYLGLEYLPQLKQGAIDAVTQYGTQFSSSRMYASLDLYQELEGKLEDIFEKPLLVAASTTLGHLATLPVIVSDNDAVILDMQVHSSIQMATQVLKARGITINMIRHNDMERLEERIRQLKEKHDKVWYFADGIYSMYGDSAPLKQLTQLLDKYPEFHLYIDDAHGMGWAGEKGCGYVRSKMAHHPKMVLAVSLNKSFAGAGGAIVFPDNESRDLVRNTGGTMIFSGPIQPPMLGVACASADFHLSTDLAPRQERLMELIHHTNLKLNALGLPQFMETDSPLFFIPAGLPAVAINIIGRMLDRGFYVNAAGFPATPMKRGGVRFMINANLTKSDIDAMLEVLVEEYVNGIYEEGSSLEKVARAFKLPEIQLHPPKATQQKALKITTAASIHDLDQAEWDRLTIGKGNFHSASLKMIEKTFTNQPEPENDWDFTYFQVRNHEGRLILSTFFTLAMVKDDMFSPAAISRQIETQRKTDPYYLTSKAIILGSLITKGTHLYLDRTAPEWKEALRLLIDAMQEEVQKTGASQLLLREFVGDTDEEFQQTLLELGLTTLRLPNVCKIEAMDWKDHAEYLSQLKGKYRYDLRREILKHEHKFRVETIKPSTPKEIRHCYDLYCEVFERSYELNVFRLPYQFFEAMCRHEDYDVIRLYLEGAEEPCAVMFSCRSGDTYLAMIVGLDYETLRENETYKQVLYRTVWRAWEMGCNHLDLAFTAETVKKKVGAKPVKANAYVQLMDHYNSAVIAAMSKVS